MQHQHCQGVSYSSWQYGTLEAAHKGEIIPNPPITSPLLGKNGNANSPGNENC